VDARRSKDIFSYTYRLEQWQNRTLGLEEGLYDDYVPCFKKIFSASLYIYIDEAKQKKGKIKEQNNNKKHMIFWSRSGDSHGPLGQEEERLYIETHFEKWKNALIFCPTNTRKKLKTFSEFCASSKTSCNKEEN
jgi:hypothetical protein